MTSTHYKARPTNQAYNNSKNESPLKTLLLLRACYHTCPVRTGRAGRAKTRGTTRIGLMLIFEVFLFEISIYTRMAPSPAPSRRPSPPLIHIHRMHPPSGTLSPCTVVYVVAIFVRSELKPQQLATIHNRLIYIILIFYVFFQRTW